ncbi:MAG: HEAT repeat domain-containing protein [Planctomycetota bacterium]|jgi:hypothetical protein
MRVAPVLLLVLVLPAFGQQLSKKEAVKKLDEAFRKKDEILQLDAIEDSAHIEDPAVVQRIAKGLRSRSPAVKSAAMRALAKNQHPNALKALHGLYRSDRNLRKSDDLFVLLLRSIAQHEDPSSVRVLSDNPYRGLTVANGTARIMGLANIRVKESAEALIQAGRKSAGHGGSGAMKTSAEWAGRFDMPYRAAMTILTGEDIGLSGVAWDEWWRKNRRTFKMAPERPKVPASVQEYWEKYWKKPYYKDGEKPDRDPLGSPYGRNENPKVEQVKAAVAAINAAFKTKDDLKRVNAIQAAAGLIHPDIVRAIARGLRVNRKAVRMAAVDALGWMKHPEGLKQLHRMYRREKDLHRQEELFAGVLKAIGRHGHKSSIKVLMDSPYKGLTIHSGRARVMGLGRIRQRDSVETLIKAMRLSSTRRPREWRVPDNPRFLIEANVAMASLTGAMPGTAKDDWQKWWRDNKKKFRMKKEFPKIPKKYETYWEEYWNERYPEGAEG